MILFIVHDKIKDRILLISLNIKYLKHNYIKNIHLYFNLYIYHLSITYCICYIYNKQNFILYFVANYIKSCKKSFIKSRENIILYMTFNNVLSTEEYYECTKYYTKRCI